MDEEEIEYAFLEGAVRAFANDVDEQYGGKYSVTFTIEKIAAGEMS